MRAIAGFLGLDWTDAMLAAGRARAQQGLHQHAELQPGGAAGQRSLGRSLEMLRDRISSAVMPRLQPYLDRWGYDA